MDSLVRHPASLLMWLFLVTALLFSLGPGLRLVAASGEVSYGYGAAGRLIKASYGNGLTITYTYDPAGNLLKRQISTTQAGLYLPFFPADASLLPLGP